MSAEDRHELRSLPSFRNCVVWGELAPPYPVCHAHWTFRAAFSSTPTSLGTRLDAPGLPEPEQLVVLGVAHGQAPPC